MEITTLDEFIAEIETTFSTYAETNDIDKVSIKTWVIECLRPFGKNICDKRETLIKIENSRALLPETFKSLHLAIKITDKNIEKSQETKKLIVEKQKIENPAQWSDVTRDYYVNYCESKITTEKIYLYNEPKDVFHNYQWLSLVKGMQKDTIAVDCLNMHPNIRNNFADKISITNRTLNTNFKTGEIYIQYNSLPCDEDGEIAIPIITTGSIKKYVKNYVSIEFIKSLIINQKTSQGLSQILPIFMQDNRLLEMEAKSEANWSGLTPGWEKRMYIKNRQAQARYDLK